MPITGNGWELLVRRQGLQQANGETRTYGSYQAYLRGALLATLSGFVCESPGPGENDHPASEDDPLRVQQGRYPLFTQSGDHYQTVGYVTDVSVTEPPKVPMPGLLLGQTGARTGILIHPGHYNTLYLSSIGCLNLTAPLRADQDMDFLDSRSRVIALIDSLKSFDPAPFNKNAIQPIANAWIVIDGEPENVLQDAPAVVAQE